MYFEMQYLKEKAEHMDLCKSAIDKNVLITLHMHLMKHSITRIMEGDPDGKVLNPNEK